MRPPLFLPRWEPVPLMISAVSSSLGKAAHAPSPSQRPRVHFPPSWAVQEPGHSQGALSGPTGDLGDPEVLLPIVDLLPGLSCQCAPPI